MKKLNFSALFVPAITLGLSLTTILDAGAGIRFSDVATAADEYEDIYQKQLNSYQNSTLAREQAEDNLANAKSDKASAEKELSAAKSNLTSAKNAVPSKQSAADSAKTKLDAANSAVASAEATYGTGSPEHTAALSDQSSAQTAYNSAESDLISAQNAVADAEAALSAAESDLNTANQNVTTANQDLNTAKNDESDAYQSLESARQTASSFAAGAGNYSLTGDSAFTDKIDNVKDEAQTFVSNAGNYTLSQGAGAITDVKQCTINSIDSAVTGSINSVNNYAKGLRVSTERFLSMASPSGIANDLTASVRHLERAQSIALRNIRTIESSSRGLIGDLAGLEPMSIQVNDLYARITSLGGRASRDTATSGMIKALRAKVNTVPGANEIRAYRDEQRRIENEINKAIPASALNQLTRAREFEKLAAQLSQVSQFPSNTINNTMAQLNQLNSLFNMSGQQLPPSVSMAVNGAEYLGQIAAFEQMGLGRIQEAQQLLQALGSGVGGMGSQVTDMMEKATAVTPALESITALAAASGGGWSDIKSSVKQAKNNFKAIKNSIADARKTAAELQSLASQLSALTGSFKQDIAKVSGGMQQSRSLQDVIGFAVKMPGLETLATQYADILDVQGTANSLLGGLNNVATGAADAVAEVSGLEQMDAQVQTRASQLKNALRSVNDFGTDARYQVVAELSGQGAIAQSGVNALNNAKDDYVNQQNEILRVLGKLVGRHYCGSGGYRGYEDEFRNSTTSYGRVCYSNQYRLSNSQYNDLKYVFEKVAALPTVDMLTTGITSATSALSMSNNINGEMRRFMNMSPATMIYQVDRFMSDLENIVSMQSQLRTLSNLANTVAKSQNLVSAVAGNVANLQNIIMNCMKIDVEALVYSIVQRMLDQVMETTVGVLWDAYGNVSGNVNFLMLPKPKEVKNVSPFSFNERKSSEDMMLELFAPQLTEVDNAEVEKLVAGIAVEESSMIEDNHPLAALAGVQFASAANNVDLSTYKKGLEYEDTMSAWELDSPSMDINWYGNTMEMGDFEATAFFPGLFQCGFDLDRSFCWYWRWHSCLFISHCYKVPYLMPSCETKLEYTEPTVHLEVSPRKATSQIANISVLQKLTNDLQDLRVKYVDPSTGQLKSDKPYAEYSVGAEDIVPSAHVFGISPIARYVSDLKPIKANHTMACDLAVEWEDENNGKFEHIQYVSVPLPSVKLTMETGAGLMDLNDWNKDWFSDDAPMVGAFPSPLVGLYLSEVENTKWNPRLDPLGKTLTGETDDLMVNGKSFNENRHEAYKAALIHEGDGSDGRRKIAGSIYEDQCSANIPNEYNKCLKARGMGTPGWGALYPRNGQIVNEDARLPLKHYAQLAYRAYDRMLEKDTLPANQGGKNLVDNLKIARGVGPHAQNFSKTEFSIDWPYQTERFPMGTDPEVWHKGYHGDNIASGGMVMTLWRDTECCIKVCCDLSYMGYKPGTSYYWNLDGNLGFEAVKWEITEVTKHK